MRMMDARTRHKRAIEALRSGVPNRDAVRELGSTQTEIERRFEERLSAVEEGQEAGGLVVSGDFGSGKSHLLEYLKHRALERRFVASKIVISKETPLYDPAKVFRSAVMNAAVPDRLGSAVNEIARSLRFESESYARFYRWVDSPEASLNERFAASLYLFENLRAADAEFSDRIVRFWSGDPIGVPELRRKLRECGASAIWAFSKLSARELALQRFRFLAGLIRAAGYAGWVLLVDEVELVGRYSLLQRGRSYAEIARWVGGFDSEPLAGVVSVLAISADFDAAVLHEKNDIDEVPNRFRARGTEEDELIAERAEQGMRIVERERLRLAPPGEEALARTYARLRQIHADAYGWQPPGAGGARPLGSRRMREYVRSWITEWDLRRLYPDYRPEIEIEPWQPRYEEERDLERPPEDEGAGSLP